MKTLLVTGGTGFLGQSLLRLAQGWTLHATFCETVPPSHSEVTFHRCDLRVKSEVKQLIHTSQPDVIIHTACSNRGSHGLEAIHSAGENLAQESKAGNIPLIHLSTDMVFDGTLSPYSEDASPKPLTAYGSIKAKTENTIQSLAPHSLIIRTSLLYGVHPNDHVTNWLLDSIQQGKSLHLFTDEIRCPIWVDNLSAALLELADSPQNGILHIAGPVALSRWDWGQMMLKVFHMENHPFIVPGTIHETGMVRPTNLTMNIHKAQQVLQTALSAPGDVLGRLLSDR
ncbi:MAG: SDR family oxidoreductase [Nitrospirae bacterium]|nr:SDR family oxidoreductase [Nitrospirota bacterium]